MTDYEDVLLHNCAPQHDGNPKCDKCVSQHRNHASARRHSDMLQTVRTVQTLPNRTAASTLLTLPPASRAGPHL